jgi:Domain of unknown function (DUF4267)
MVRTGQRTTFRFTHHLALRAMTRSPLLRGAVGERECVTRIASLRMVLGGGALLTSGLARRLFGLPADQDTPTARTLGRLFGIRNIVLGYWAYQSRDADKEARRFCYQINMLVDAVDVAVLLWPVLRRQHIDRFAMTSIALGSSVALAWADVLKLLDEA